MPAVLSPKDQPKAALIHSNSPIPPTLSPACLHVLQQMLLQVVVLQQLARTRVQVGLDEARADRVVDHGVKGAGLLHELAVQALAKLGRSDRVTCIELPH